MNTVTRRLAREVIARAENSRDITPHLRSARALLDAGLERGQVEKMIRESPLGALDKRELLVAIMAIEIWRGQ